MSDLSKKMTVKSETFVGIIFCTFCYYFMFLVLTIFNRGAFLVNLSYSPHFFLVLESVPGQY